MAVKIRKIQYWKSRLSPLRIQEIFKRWRWIILGIYGTILFIISANLKGAWQLNADVLQQQMTKPNVFLPLDSKNNRRDVVQRTINKDEIILDKYMKYIRTHNITVTMFTTFADREESRYVIQNNTLLNWLHLQNVNFKLVLFGNRHEIAEYHLQHIESYKKRLHLREVDSSKENEDTANNDLLGHGSQARGRIKKFVDAELDERLKHASFPNTNKLYKSKMSSQNNPYYQTWDFIPLTKNLTALGRPILKQMFLEVQRRYHSDLYMYVNGDILFHAESLLQSLYAVKQYVDDPVTKTDKWLIFGGRREVNFFNTSTSSNHVLKFGDDAEIQNVSLRSRVLNHNALDFFICSKTSFPWMVVPEFVVSLPLFDHWLVLYSNKVGIETFDISRTALVVHQMGVKKLKDSKYVKADDLNTYLFNRAVGIRCAFDTYQARLECMKQQTRRQRVGDNDVVVIVKNNDFNTFKDMGCIYPYPLIVPVLGPVSEQDFWNFISTL